MKGKGCVLCKQEVGENRLYNTFNWQVAGLSRRIVLPVYLNRLPSHIVIHVVFAARKIMRLGIFLLECADQFSIQPLMSIMSQ